MRAMTAPHRNGHTPAPEEPAATTNPYAEAVAGSRPRELVEFELHTDPYANMLPRVSSVTALDDGDDADGELAPRRQHPIMVIISLALVAILVLPIMAEVFIRLIH